MLQVIAILLIFVDGEAVHVFAMGRVAAAVFEDALADVGGYAGGKGLAKWEEMN